MRTVNFQMFKLVLEKAEEPEIKSPHSLDHGESKGVAEKRLLWFQIGKGVRQGCILLPWLFKLYTEYIMRNAGLEEAQAGIKTAGRNINNFKYADDTTLMAESEEELKNLLVKLKEEGEKAGLKLNILKQRSWHSVLSLHCK